MYFPFHVSCFWSYHFYLLFSQCLSEKATQTVKLDASTVEIEERGVKLRLTVVDTPGFGDAIDNTDWWGFISQSQWLKITLCEMQVLKWSKNYTFQLPSYYSIYWWPIWKIPSWWKWLEQTQHCRQSYSLLLLLYFSFWSWVSIDLRWSYFAHL